MSDFTQQLDEMKDCTVVTNDYLERVNKALDELQRVLVVNAQLASTCKNVASWLDCEMEVSKRGTHGEPTFYQIRYTALRAIEMALEEALKAAEGES